MLGFPACSSAESFLQANTDLKTEVDVARAGQRFAEYERFKINQMNIARYSPHQYPYRTCLLWCSICVQTAWLSNATQCSTADVAVQQQMHNTLVLCFLCPSCCSAWRPLSARQLIYGVTPYRFTCLASKLRLATVTSQIHEG